MYLRDSQGGGHTSISLILIYMIKASFLQNFLPLSHLAQFLHVSAGLPGEGTRRHFFDLNLHDKSFISTKFRTFVTFSTIFTCICDYDFMFFSTVCSLFKGFECVIQKNWKTQKISGHLLDPKK